jgi:hypothetical protein
MPRPDRFHAPRTILIGGLAAIASVVSLDLTT